MTKATYERIRLGQSRNVVDDVAVGKITIDVVLTYLVELSNKTVDGLTLRFTLLKRQAHRKEIFHEFLKQRRRIFFNFKGWSLRCQPSDGILNKQ